jgi:hypothetical protein
MSTPTQQPATGIATYTTTIDAGSHDAIPILFTYRTDGTGTTKDVNYDGEETSFTWDPTILEDLDAGEIDATLSDHARELFWDEINDELGEDRILQEGDYGSDVVTFENGSEEELGQIVRLMVYAFPEIWEDDRDEIDVVIRTRTENEEAHLDPDNGLTDDPDISEEIKTHLGALVDLALNWIDPYGWSLEYNDGAYERASGHYESANMVEYTISRPSFHEMAEARGELLRIFAKHELEQDAKDLLLEDE